MEAKIRILAADDTLIAREGWKLILADEPDMTVIGVATLAQETARQVRALRPDVVLLDLKWFDDQSAGVAAIEQIRALGLPVKVIAITVARHLAEPARRAGADAVLPKGFSKAELVALIRALAQAPGHFPAPYAARPTSIRQSPGYLAAAIGIPVIGFALMAGVLLWGIRSLSLPQFAAVASVTLAAYLFTVVFAAGYVRVLGETPTYRLMARLLRGLQIRLPGSTGWTKRGADDAED